MIGTPLVGLHFTGNNGHAMRRGTVVARCEPGWYLVQTDGRLHLVEISTMAGWIFDREKRP